MSEEAADPVRLPARIESDRLVIRLWEPDDAPAQHIVVTRSVEHLRPWMAWIAFEPLTVDDRRINILGWHQEWVDGGQAIYGIFIKDEAEVGAGPIVGGTGLHPRVGSGGLEIGYWIDVEHVGRGYAGEVAAALTEAALAHPGIDRVEIHHDKANAISARIPERLGYTFIGEEPAEPVAPAEIGINCNWRRSRR